MGVEPTKPTITLNSSALVGEGRTRDFLLRLSNSQPRSPTPRRSFRYDSEKPFLILSWRGGAGIEPAPLAWKAITLNSSALTGK